MSFVVDILIFSMNVSIFEHNDVMRGILFRSHHYYCLLNDFLTVNGQRVLTSILFPFYHQVPLLHLILPTSTVRDMVASLVVKAQQGRWMPIFPAWNSYTGKK